MYDINKELDKEELLSENYISYIYGVYVDDIEEYVDGAIYTENERARIEQELEDLDGDTTE